MVVEIAKWIFDGVILCDELLLNLEGLQWVFKVLEVFVADKAEVESERIATADILIFGVNFQGELNLQPLNIKLLIDQVHKLFPALGLLVNLLELFHIGRQQIQ